MLDGREAEAAIQRMLLLVFLCIQCPMVLYRIGR